MSKKPGIPLAMTALRVMAQMNQIAPDSTRFLEVSIYIGRRFKNDTERLEKLFDLYTRMTSAEPAKNRSKRKS